MTPSEPTEGSGPQPSGDGWTLERPPHEERYRRGALLGAGGMGRVYAALDQRLGREVALKEVKPGADAAALSRLAREVRITALLEHPGIVPVYDSEEGTHTYTMRLVRGRSLAEALRSTADREARLGLVRRVHGACEALAYAHSIGVVHRDVKPDNVMIGEFGQTLVVDWGLARVLPGSRVSAALSSPACDAEVTQVGAVLGTPRYMSPEQASGSPATPASDVWALGAVLYEIVSGHPPRRGDDARHVLEQARGGSPPKLSTLAPDAPPELVAIVERATSVAPEDRYPSAAELAEDLGRYLDGRRVAAHAYTSGQLARRFARRWRVALLLVALAAVAVSATAVWGWSRTSRALDRALVAEADARGALARGDAWLADALVQQALHAEARDAAPEAELLGAHALVLGGSPVARGLLAGLAVGSRPVRVGRIEAPDGCDAITLADDGSIALCQVGGGLSAWSTDPLTRLWTQDLDVRAAVLLPAQRRAVVWLSEGASLAVLDLGTGALLAQLGPYVLGQGLTHSRDGRYLALGAPNHLRVLDTVATTEVVGPWAADLVATVAFSDDRITVIGREGALIDGPVSGPWTTLQTPFSHRREARTVLPLPDGGWLIGTVSGQLARLDRGGRSLVEMNDFQGAILGIVLLPDQRTAVVHGAHGAPRLFDLATAAWMGRFPNGEGHRAALAPDGSVLVGPDPTWRWKVPGPAAPRVVAIGDGATSLDVTPDGQWLAAGVGGGRAFVWDLQSVDPPRVTPMNPTGAVLKDVVFGPGASLYTVDTIHGLRVHGALPLEDSGEPYRRVGLLKDGPRDVIWALGYAREGPALWDAGTGRAISSVLVSGRELVEGEPSADRRAAALLDSEGRIYVMRGDPLRVDAVRSVHGAHAVDVVPAHELLAIGGGTRVEVVRLTDGVTVCDVDALGAVVDVALSPDGRRVAGGDASGRVRVWSVSSGALLAEMPGHADRVAAVRFSSDGALLFSADWAGQVRRWRMSVLEADPRALRAEVEDAWGLTLDQVLADRGAAGPTPGSDQARSPLE